MKEYRIPIDRVLRQTAMITVTADTMAKAIHKAWLAANEEDCHWRTFEVDYGGGYDQG